MRIRLLAIWVLLFGLLLDPAFMMAQNATPESTPEFEPPRFSISALGDYSTGYFDNIEAAPGETINLTVAIDNFGSVPVELKTYKVNALNGANGGYLSGPEDDDPTGSNQWVKYPTETFHLAPGERKTRDFSVTVPDGTAPGQYISGLHVETAEPISIPGDSFLNQTLTYAISLGILVPGEIAPDFSLGEPSVTSIGELVVPIENTGNYLVRPAGELVLKTQSGEVVHTSGIEMGSVYAGNTSSVSVWLPEQMLAGDYILDVFVSDSESNVVRSIEGATVTVAEPVDATGLSVVNNAVEPNADEIVFANVDVTLNNGGQQIPAANVILEVMRDGEVVDEFPLATNQVLLSGENQFVTRYLPADMWQNGTYTFAIVVSAVDPNGGQETILLDEELDATIVVP